MNIQINKESKTTSNNREYNYYDLQINTKRVEIIKSSVSGINVIVHNASHKAWNANLGIGKQFKCIDDAISKYRDKSILSILNYVKTKEL